MKLVLISDTHTQHSRLCLPEGDVLIHAGDWSLPGKLKEALDFAGWLKTQPHKTKVVIAGNHDFSAQAFMTENSEQVLRDIFAPAHYLRDSSLLVGDVLIYGSPWQPWFYNWAFNLQRGLEIRAKWDLIPPHTDVLVTHGPPMGILDQPGGCGTHVGCQDLMDAVSVIKPKIHVFGHIHGGYGQKEFNGTQFFNASVVNESYRVVNEPLIAEI